MHCNHWSAILRTTHPLFGAAIKSLPLVATCVCVHHLKKNRCRSTNGPAATAKQQHPDRQYRRWCHLEPGRHRPRSSSLLSHHAFFPPSIPATTTISRPAMPAATRRSPPPPDRILRLYLLTAVPRTYLSPARCCLSISATDYHHKTTNRSAIRRCSTTLHPTNCCRCNPS